MKQHEQAKEDLKNILWQPLNPELKDFIKVLVDKVENSKEV